MSDQASHAPLLAARGVIKRFGAVLANDVSEFAVHAGEVVALLGENGAGKSTLCKILYGYYQPDAGEIRVAGQPVTISSPRDARGLGIGMVFQNFSLIPALTVWENIAIFLDHLPFVIGRERIRLRAGRLAERLGLDVDFSLPAGRLAVGQRQKLEILKQVLAGARVLILDEPTKVLAPQEAAALFRSIADLRAEGYGIIYITHKLHEVMACADRVAVMRGGRVVGTLPGPAASETALLDLMFADAAPLPVPARPLTLGVPVLELDHVSTGLLHDVSLRLGAGEILGVAGVSGNGQGELGELVLGLRPPGRGSKRLFGEAAESWSVAKIRARGVVSIPDDPLALAAIAALTVRENCAVGNAGRYRRGLGVAWRRVTRDMDASAARIGFPPLRHDTRAGVLSGGTLQRVVLTRELAAEPRLIVALYPTRGLDRRSAESLHAVLSAARAGGAACLLVSEDLDELFLLADRLVVLRDGSISGRFSRESFRADLVGPCMVGPADAA